MALVVKDRVRETSTTTGTGTLTLAGAVSGFQTFSSAIGNTNTTYYTIINGTEWETGLGTVAAGTLARTTVLESSNAGSAVNFSAGTKDVFGTYPASKALYKDASGNAIGLGTVAATTTLTSATGLPLSTGVTGTLPIANGGTGTTSLAAATIATQGYTTTATAAGTTTLTVSSTQLQFFTGTTTQTVVLPVASTLTSGQRFEIHNNSTGSVTVNSSGANLVSTVSANTTVVCTCILTSGTTAASWDADVQGFTTSLPAALGGTGLTASGTSGNVLTSDGTTWTSATPATPNTAGGATATSSAVNVTLTSSSNKVQNVSMTATGKAVILPDATTLSTGTIIFTISNTGYLSFNINLNGGVTLTSLTTGQSVQLSLIDKSTTNGTWNISNTTISNPTTVTQYSPVQVDSNAIKNNTNNGGDAQGNINGSQCDVIALTSTTALITWIRSSNNSVYGVVATNTGGTISYGTVTQIYNGATTAALCSNTRMLTGLTTGICFVDRGNTSFCVAVPFSISGSTITVGTQSASFGGTTGTDQFILCGLAVMSSTVILASYSTSSANFVYNTVTYNGASAPTLGTASAATTLSSANFASAYLLPLTSTTAQAFYMSAISTFTTRVITISGTSAPTLGTVLNITTQTGGQGYARRAPIQGYVYSSTQTAIMFAYSESRDHYTTSFTISGTTVTQQGTLKNMTPFLLGSSPAWFSSTTGYYINTIPTNTGGLSTTSTGVYKYAYIAGDNIYFYGNSTSPTSSYLYLTAITNLTSTVGIVAGVATDSTLYANVVTLV